MADGLCWLLAARALVEDVLVLKKEGAGVIVGAEGFVNFYTDLCHVITARAGGEVGRICAELVYGYQRHPAWGAQKSCMTAQHAGALESLMPGFESMACGCADLLDEEGGLPKKAGPCVRLEGFEQFAKIRAKLDTCLTGVRLAKDRAASALTKIMIPESLDYPS